LALGLILLAAVTAPAVRADESDPHGGAAAVQHADPIDASMLEVQQARSQVERAWFSTPGGWGARASRTRTTAFALGIANVEAAARALIAPGDEADTLGNAMLAVRLAPDLPIARMALARVMWSQGDRLGALEQAASGVTAIFQHFEAMAWLLGSLLVMIAAVMIVAPLIFVVSVAISVFRHATHDLGDVVTRHMPEFARAALLGCLLLVPLALGEGIMGLVLSLFALGFLYGTSRHRVALGLAVVFFLAGLYPVARTAGTVLIALDSDPVATATLAVVQGEETPADVALLEQASENEFLAKHILAVRARRMGRIDEATARYAELVAANPRSAEGLANYANLLFLSGDDETAVDFYQRAAALVDSARVMFNLSQANARMFRIEAFETALRRAQELDTETVVALSRSGDAGFVADLGFPLAALRSRLLAAARERHTSRLAVEWLMPGWLGGHPLRSAAAFAFIALLGGVFSTRFDKASCCARCGQRICSRCDSSRWNAETCDACYHLFHQSETTDPVLRMRRLHELQTRDTRIHRVALLGSLLIPGVAGLRARRPDLAFLGIVVCGFAVAFFAWPNGVVPDPLAVGSAGTLAFALAGTLAVLLNLMIVAAGLMMRRNQ